MRVIMKRKKFMCVSPAKKKKARLIAVLIQNEIRYVDVTHCMNL